MKTLFLILATLLISVIGRAQSVSCLYGAVNMSQRLAFAQYGAIQGFGPGCLVVQQDTSTLYMWDGSAYQLVSGAGIGITSLSSQVGQTQIFANDTNVVMTHSNNTHALGWSGTLSVARGGSGSALSPVLGGVIYSDATKLNVLAAGTSGQCLTSAGAALPAWGACGGGSGLTSLNAMTGSTQIFSNDTNITVTSSNNTHAMGWAGSLSLARGGTNASVTAAAGRVVYSTATALATMATTGTSGQVLLSGGVNTPTWGPIVSVSATASRIVQRDSNANIVTKNYLSCVDTINSTPVTVNSNANCNIQSVTTSGATTIGLASSTPTSFTIINNSTGLVTVQDQGANTIAVIPIGVSALFTTGALSSDWTVSMNGIYASANLGSAGFRFSAEVDATGVVSGENIDWITSNCALASSVFTCTVVTGIFSGTPKCQSTVHGSTSGLISVNPGSATSVVVSTFAASGLAGDRAFTLTCSF